MAANEIEKYRSVNRTITLPKWLNDKVKQSKINVSAVLQKRLIEILGNEKDKELK